MEDIINIIVNNGIGVACMVYFMYFNNTILKNITEALNEMKQNLVILNERVKDVEVKLDKRKGD